MSNSKLISATYPAYKGNYTTRSSRTIKAITIHHMAGKLTAKTCGNIFARVGRKGSSHYGIGINGEIALYVDEKNIAWTNSNWKSNCESVTIETANCEIGGQWKVSDVVLNSLIKLVADIAKRNKLGTLVKGKNVTWHRMYCNTSCPGPYLLSKMDYIIAEANKINATEEVKPDIDKLAAEVIQGKYGNGQTRKNKLGSLYGEVQARVDEILGKSKKYITINAKAGVWCRKGAGFKYAKYKVIPYKTKLELLEKNVKYDGGYNWDRVKYNNIVVYLPNKWNKY